jgi:hypothetical protein
LEYGPDGPQGFGKSLFHKSLAAYPNNL